VVRDRLRRLYELTGALRELAGMTLEDARAVPDVAGRFALLLRAGRLLIDAEDGDEAVSVLEEARGLRPEEPEGALLLADAYATAGRRPAARALLGEMIAAHRGRRARALGPVYHRLARLESLDARPQEALAALVKAFENDPQNGPLAMELAGFALERGEHDLAARAFRAVTMMKIAPEGSTEGTTSFARAVAYYHLATMALAIGDRRKARLMLDKSVVEDSSLEAARALLEELRGG
jgi:tetratricopeptide (TPR) repeat protein